MGETGSAIRIEEIRDAKKLKLVEELAGKIFPPTYAELIPPAQTPYMMHVMYDDEVLRRELAEGVHFALIFDGEKPIGYISWHYLDAPAFRLEKLYLDFAYHGRSNGKAALEFVIDRARSAGAEYLSLNVNKGNVRAQKAYSRVGFYRWRCDRESVGNGFFKDDYVMRCELGSGLNVDPVGLVKISDVVPDARLDIRYYSTNNFIGERIDGYEAPVALLTVAAAEALKAVSDEVKKSGFRLKIFDAYRPLRAVARFVRWAQDSDDTLMKADYYPDIDKSEILPRGYIVERSGHSRGSTVDLTLCDAISGQEVDMGGTFDWFGQESHPDWCGDPETGVYTGEAVASPRRITAAQFQNRLRLREVMKRHGFLPLEQEWWHFTLANEPYPDTYFDYPVK